MNLNQLSIIGFIGKNAETKQLPNGTPVMTREYDRTINTPAGNGKTIEHTLPQLVFELKAEAMRIPDGSSAIVEQVDAAEPAINEDPY